MNDFNPTGWHIYPHLVDFYGKCSQIYQSYRNDSKWFFSKSHGPLHCVDIMLRHSQHHHWWNTQNLQGCRFFWNKSSSEILLPTSESFKVSSFSKSFLQKSIVDLTWPKKQTTPKFEMKKVHLSHEKNLYYFSLYWLVNRDPYKGLLKSLYTWE